MSRVGDLSTRIFVGGLNNDVNELDLEKAFKLFGEITNVMVMRDKENGRSRGFAFVSFREKQASEEAINRMHGVEIRGRCVSVRHAEKEKFLSDDRPKRGGFRGGRVGHHVGNRQDHFHGMTGFSGNDYRGFLKPSDRVFVTDDGDDYQDHGTGGTSLRSSRSPPSESRRYYRHDKSPPRDRRFSPEPPQRDHYFPHGHMPITRREDDYYGQRQSESPPFDKFHGYETSQAMSPTRELNAYIQARGIDYSPPPTRPTRKVTPDQIRRRSPSPRLDQYRRESPKQGDYSIFSSDSKHPINDSRLEKRSRDARMKTTSKDNFRDGSTSPVGGKYRKVGSTYSARRYEKSDTKPSFRDQEHSPQEKQQERHSNSQRGPQNRGPDRRRSPFGKGKYPEEGYAKFSSTSRKNEFRSEYRKQSPEQLSSQRAKLPASPQRRAPARYKSPEKLNLSLRKSPSPCAENRYRSTQKHRSPEMSRYKTQKQISPSRRSPARFGSSQRQRSSLTVPRKSPVRYQSPGRQRSSPGRYGSFQAQRSPTTNLGRSSARYSSPERKVSSQQRPPPRERFPQRRTPDTRDGYQSRNTTANRGDGNTRYPDNFVSKRGSFNGRRPERDDRRRDFGRQADRSSPPRRRSPVIAKSYY